MKKSANAFSSSYSHTLVIYIDPKSQKKCGVEALIDSGVVANPLDIDLEPSFKLVAEWLDFSSTVNYRIKDSIVKAVLPW